MSCIAWIIVGAIAGWGASQVMERRLSLVMEIFIGIMGAFVGGALLSLLGFDGEGLVYTTFAAFVGATVLLWGAQQLR